MVEKDLKSLTMPTKENDLEFSLIELKLFSIPEQRAVSMVQSTWKLKKIGTFKNWILADNK